MSRSLTTAGVEVRSSSRPSTSTRNPRPTPGHPHSTRKSRFPHVWERRVAVWHHGCSGRRRARPPARLGDLTSFGTAPRSPPLPSGPSGALHTSDAWRAVCCQARRCDSGQALPPPTGTAARPPGPSGAIHTSDAWRAVCCQARRCDSGQALPPPTGTAASPPGPSGALHTSGALSL